MTNDKKKPPLIFIVGPTASGKSELALRVAEKSGAEICSVDAFQVYRGLDIGTGKLKVADRAGIPHHLMDIVDPLEPFTVADYLHRAGEILSDLNAREKASVWVGGTGLYFRALREGLSPVPASDAGLVRELSSLSLQQLQSEVKRLDPVWSETADLNNPRRIIRALAVVKQTGRPLSAWHEIKGHGLIENAPAFFLQPDPDVLRKRMERRVENMWKEGWKQEVEHLLQCDGWSDSQSARAIGYSQVTACLNKVLSEEECLEAIQLKTWQYARRQLTWFRSEENLVRLELQNGVEAMVQAIDKAAK